ncbi:MAG TPA: PKD domain-containing protein [Bacteroidia bacterium]|nr:PKD domain-containing protein [Bacteroidia bacterium]
MLRDSNLCGIDTAIITVQVVSPPTASLAAPGGNLCQNAVLNFTNASPPGVSYLWNFGDGGGFVNLGNGNKNHTYTSAGTFTVKLVAFVGGAGSACTDTAYAVVNILASPVANFTVNPASGCNSIINATFTESSTLAVQWSWVFGNGNTSTLQAPPPQNYTLTGSFTASLTVTASTSCSNSKTLSVVVRPNPLPAFPPITACVGSAANFSNTSTITGTNPITSYTWNFGDGSAVSTQTNPSHTYTAPSTYTVKLIAASAFCKDSISQNVLVNLKPTANFVFSPTISCPPFVVSFSNTSVNNSTSLWKFGVSPTSTSNLSNPTYTYLNSSQSFLTYTVSLQVGTGAGCSDSLKKVLIVKPRPVANFISNNLSGGCSPYPATFTNTSVGASTYTWNFGDGLGSAATNPVHPSPSRVRTTAQGPGPATGS